MIYPRILHRFEDITAMSSLSEIRINKKKIIINILRYILFILYIGFRWIVFVKLRISIPDANDIFTNHMFHAIESHDNGGKKRDALNKI